MTSNSNRFQTSVDNTFTREQMKGTLLHQSKSNLDDNQRWFGLKHPSGEGYLGLALLLKPTQSTPSVFHVLPRISSRNLKVCNIGTKEADTGRNIVVGPKSMVSLPAGFKPFLFNDENYVTHHAHGKQEGSTSSWGLPKSLRGSTSRSSGRRGLSLAFAQSIAIGNMGSSSQLPGLQDSTDIDLEEALADEIFSEGDEGGTETGMNEGALVKNFSQYTLTPSLLQSDVGVKIACHKQAGTSGEVLEVGEARLVEKDGSLKADTPTLGTGSGEEEINEYCEDLQESLISTEETSPYELNPGEAPPGFYIFRWKKESRPHLDAEPILKPTSCGELANENIQHSAPMEVPRQKSQHGRSAKRKYAYAYSMTQGVGRTLKGRDQREFRNNVLRLTGFIEDQT